MRSFRLAALAACALAYAPALARAQGNVIAPSGNTPVQGLGYGAVGQAATAVTPATPLPVASPQTVYALLTNASATGAPVVGIVSGGYVWTCQATTWNSATAELKFLGPKGTYLSTSPTATTLTADGSKTAVAGSNSTAEVVVTGSPTGLTCTLS